MRHSIRARTLGQPQLDWQTQRVKHRHWKIRSNLDFPVLEPPGRHGPPRQRRGNPRPRAIPLARMLPLEMVTALGKYTARSARARTRNKTPRVRAATSNRELVGFFFLRGALGGHCKIVSAGGGDPEESSIQGECQSRLYQDTVQGISCSACLIHSKGA